MRGDSLPVLQPPCSFPHGSHGARTLPAAFRHSLPARTCNVAFSVHPPAVTDLADQAADEVRCCHAHTPARTSTSLTACYDRTGSAR